MEMKNSLSKYIAQAGLCSRRQATEFIKAGKVCVNGHIVKEPGYKVPEGARVTVEGKVVARQGKVYLLMNKPKGYITSVTDDRGRKTVMDLVDKKMGSRIYPVGRLDKDTTGLLLLTNDGYLAQQLAHPRYNIQKTYIVVLDKALRAKDMITIRDGVYLSDGMVKVDSIVCMTKVYCKKVKVVLHSGRYRVIRRLFMEMGYFVLELDRVGYAGLKKSILRKGSVRRLTEKEVAFLRTLVF